MKSWPQQLQWSLVLDILFSPRIAFRYLFFFFNDLIISRGISLSKLTHFFNFIFFVGVVTTVLMWMLYGVLRVDQALLWLEENKKANANSLEPILLFIVFYVSFSIACYLYFRFIP